MAAPLDACTGFPEHVGTVVITLCCVDHDAAFVAGGSLLDFLAANLSLGACVAALGSSPALALVGAIMAIGTTLLGLPFWLRAWWRRRRR